MDEPGTFGEWLKQQRRALHLTQEALAAQLYCALGTLRKIESDERRPSRELAERLAEVLQVPPEHQPMFVKVARGELALDRLALPPDPASAPPRPIPARPPNNLRLPRTSFIGRGVERAQVEALLLREDVGLLTLTGPGGTGKTRLALEVATALRDSFGDGVWFVDLAPLTDPETVAQTITQALGVRETPGQSLIESLTSHLRDRQMLLLLDNFEQVVDAAPVVSEMLRAARQLTVLVTSRIVLHLSEEHEFAVSPLTLPKHLTWVEPEQIVQSEAVRLFVGRAQAANVSFTLAPENAKAIAELCNRLDGLPLALELAAARSKLFSPRALLERLDNRLMFLTGGARDLPSRQLTIRNTIDWSYQLLSTDDRRLFSLLSVFAGGASLDAIEAVCGAWDGWSGTIVDGLQSLADNSLIRLVESADGEPRFSMLETVREFAKEALEAMGAGEQIREQHALFFLELTARTGTTNTKTDMLMTQLEAEQENLRSTLRWSYAIGRYVLWLRLGTAATTFWHQCGSFNDGRAWMDDVVALLEAEQPLDLSPDLRGEVLDSIAGIAINIGDDRRAFRYGEESLQLFRELGEYKRVAYAARRLGYIALTLGQDEAAGKLLHESMTVAGDIGDTEGLAWSYINLAEWARLQGEYEQAAAWSARSRPLLKTLGDAYGLLLIAEVEGFLALGQGNISTAAMRFVECVEHGRRIANAPRALLAFSLVGFAGVALSKGQALRGVRLLGAATPLYNATGIVMDRGERMDYDHWMAAAHSSCDPMVFDHAWAEGQAMTLQQAIAYAMDET